MNATRREFLLSSAATTSGLLMGSDTALAARAEAIEVVVWDERQPAQKQTYGDFLGNTIAAHLRTQPGLSVRSVGLDDSEQGLTDEVLGSCRVLVWWGHVRQGEVKPEVGKRIVERIKTGKLSLVALHSAHWSTPFMEAMNERSRLDIARKYPQGDGAVEIKDVPPPQRNTLPKYESRITPYVREHKFPKGGVKLDLHLPYCCFPSYRADGKPSYLKALKLDHPIVRGVPSSFEIPQEEMYDEPFHVPEPDEIVIEERWPTGEWFRSGMVWRIGKGQVFYFRPGHETFPVYKQEIPLKIITNAVNWLGS